MATLSPEQVILGYNNAVQQVRTAVDLYATRSWASAGSWRDGDVDRLVNLILPKVQAGQIQVAQLTSAYVASLAKYVDGRTVKASTVSRSMILDARKATPTEVYRRPAVQMYTALAGGASLTEAVSQGVNRLSSLVLTDLQLAKTHQERVSYSGAGYEYTIRTLTGRENCALCEVATTQRYHVKNLRPIHPGCDCGSRQVSAAFDPGQVIDANRLSQIHSAVEEQFGQSDRGARYIDGLKTVQYSDGVRGADYTDLIVVREHGELGPLLTWRDQHFTGPNDL